LGLIYREHNLIDFLQYRIADLTAEQIANIDKVNQLIFYSFILRYIQKYGKRMKADVQTLKFQLQTQLLTDAPWIDEQLLRTVLTENQPLSYLLALMDNFIFTDDTTLQLKHCIKRYKFEQIEYYLEGNHATLSTVYHTYEHLRQAYEEQKEDLIPAGWESFCQFCDYFCNKTIVDSSIYYDIEAVLRGSRLPLFFLYCIATLERKSFDEVLLIFNNNLIVLKDFDIDTTREAFAEQLMNVFYLNKFFGVSPKSVNRCGNGLLKLTLCGSLGICLIGEVSATLLFILLYYLFFSDTTLKQNIMDDPSNFVLTVALMTGFLLVGAASLIYSCIIGKNLYFNRQYANDPLILMARLFSGTREKRAIEQRFGELFDSLSQVPRHDSEKCVETLVRYHAVASRTSANECEVHFTGQNVAKETTPLLELN